MADDIVYDVSSFLAEVRAAKNEKKLMESTDPALRMIKELKQIESNRWRTTPKKQAHFNASKWNMMLEGYDVVKEMDEEAEGDDDDAMEEYPAMREIDEMEEGEELDEADRVIGFAHIPRHIHAGIQSAAQEVAQGVVDELTAERRVEQMCDSMGCDEHTTDAAKEELYHKIKKLGVLGEADKDEEMEEDCGVMEADDADMDEAIEEAIRLTFGR